MIVEENIGNEDVASELAVEKWDVRTFTLVKCLHGVHLARLSRSGTYHPMDAEAFVLQEQMHLPKIRPQDCPATWMVHRCMTLVGEVDQSWTNRIIHRRRHGHRFTAVLIM